MGVLWSGGTQAAQAMFPEVLRPEQPIDDTKILLVYVAYSAALSLLAGFVTAVVGRDRSPMTAVWILAVLQLALGIGFELSYWNLMPAWYHLLFLALLIPATLGGGILRTRSRWMKVTGS